MASYQGDYSSRSASSKLMDEQPQSELFTALRQLYRGSEYSDLTIVLRDGSKLPAHRAIVCTRSSFLAQAVKEKRWNESVEGEVGMLDEDPELVNLVFEYLYLLDYVAPTSSPSTSSSRSRHDSDSVSVRTDPIHFGHVYGTSAVSAFGGPRDSLSAHAPFTVPFGHARERSDSQLTVHALPGVADFTVLSRPEGHRRVNARSSMTVAAPDPSPLATREPNLVLHAKMYAAGERYGIHGLKVLAHDKFKIQLTRHWDSPEFAEAIHVAYNSTSSSDKELRETVADTIGWHSRLVDKPEIEIAIMDINGLAYELLKRARRAEPEYS